MLRPIQLTESREVYRGRIMRIREDHVVLPRGSHAVFNVAEIREGATVLALDAGQYVHLIREYRWAVDRVSVEAISGGMEDGESALECARRELREEGGLVAAEWIALGKVDPFTSHVRSPNYVFLARGLTPVDTSHEEGEVIEAFRVPLAEAIRMMERGEITHAATVVALLRAARIEGV